MGYFFQELSGLRSYSGRQGYFGGGWIKNGIFFFRSYRDYGVIWAGQGYFWGNGLKTGYFFSGVIGITELFGRDRVIWGETD